MCCIDFCASNIFCYTALGPNGTSKCTGFFENEAFGDQPIFDNNSRLFKDNILASLFRAATFANNNFAKICF